VSLAQKIQEKIDEYMVHAGVPTQEEPTYCSMCDTYTYQLPGEPFHGYVNRQVRVRNKAVYFKAVETMILPESAFFYIPHGATPEGVLR
jgi:hypothetical protein